MYYIDFRLHIPYPMSIKHQKSPRIYNSKGVFFILPLPALVPVWFSYLDWPGGACCLGWC